MPGRLTDGLRVLVIGAGIGGMAAAIALRRCGASVELIDIDPNWRVYGAGITITGPTLRAILALGVYEEISAQGYVGNGIRVCDVDGRFLRDLETPIAPEAGAANGGAAWWWRARSRSAGSSRRWRRPSSRCHRRAGAGRAGRADLRSARSALTRPLA